VYSGASVCQRFRYLNNVTEMHHHQSSPHQVSCVMDWLMAAAFGGCVCPQTSTSSSPQPNVLPQSVFMLTRWLRRG
jgi:hypothetical protein